MDKQEDRAGVADVQSQNSETLGTINAGGQQSSGEKRGTSSAVEPRSTNQAQIVTLEGDKQKMGADNEADSALLAGLRQGSEGAARIDRKMAERQQRYAETDARQQELIVADAQGKAEGVQPETDLQRRQQEADDAVALMSGWDESGYSGKSYDDAVAAQQALMATGNVDLLNRPQIDAATMRKSGWNVPDGSTATVMTCDYIWPKDKGGDGKFYTLTPISADGRVLTQAELNSYWRDISRSGDPLNTDKPENGGFGLLITGGNDAEMGSQIHLMQQRLGEGDASYEPVAVGGGVVPGRKENREGAPVVNGGQVGDVDKDKSRAAVGRRVVLPNGEKKTAIEGFGTKGARPYEAPEGVHSTKHRGGKPRVGDLIERPSASDGKHGKSVSTEQEGPNPSEEETKAKPEITRSVRMRRDDNDDNMVDVVQNADDEEDDVLEDSELDDGEDVDADDTEEDVTSGGDSGGSDSEDESSAGSETGDSERPLSYREKQLMQRLEDAKSRLDEAQDDDEKRFWQRKVDLYNEHLDRAKRDADTFFAEDRELKRREREISDQYDEYMRAADQARRDGNTPEALEYERLAKERAEMIERYNDPKYAKSRRAARFIAALGDLFQSFSNFYGAAKGGYAFKQSSMSAAVGKEDKKRSEEFKKELAYYTKALKEAAASRDKSRDAMYSGLVKRANTFYEKAMQTLRLDRQAYNTKQAQAMRSYDNADLQEQRYADRIAGQQNQHRNRLEQIKASEKAQKSIATHRGNIQRANQEANKRRTTTSTTTSTREAIDQLTGQKRTLRSSSSTTRTTR